MQTNPHRCINCAHIFTGKYCNNCGQKVFTDHDKSVGHFFHDYFHFITHFEGTFFNTLKVIFRRPGQLSLDYARGKQKSYFKPLSFFLLLVIIYLLFPVFEGLNMKLYYHVRHNVYGEYAMRKVAHLLQTTGMDEEELGRRFAQKSEKVSKFLLLVLVPGTALFFWAFTFRKRKHFYDHLMLATEVNSLYLLWGFLIMPLLLTIFQLVGKLFSMRTDLFSDENIGLFVYIPICIYAGIAAGRFYLLKRWQAILFGIAFYIVHFIVVQVLYKFLLFALVINQIH
jgi:hypothetical protein